MMVLDTGLVDVYRRQPFVQGWHRIGPGQPLYLGAGDDRVTSVLGELRQPEPMPARYLAPGYAVGQPEVPGAVGPGAMQQLVNVVPGRHDVLLQYQHIAGVLPH